MLMEGLYRVVVPLAFHSSHKKIVNRRYAGSPRLASPEGIHPYRPTCRRDLSAYCISVLLDPRELLAAHRSRDMIRPKAQTSQSGHTRRLVEGDISAQGI